MHLDWCKTGAHWEAFCTHAALLGLEHIHGYALGWVSSSFRRIRGVGTVF